MIKCEINKDKKKGFSHFGKLMNFLYLSTDERCFAIETNFNIFHIGFQFQ